MFSNSRHVRWGIAAVAAIGAIALTPAPAAAAQSTCTYRNNAVETTRNGTLSFGPARKEIDAIPGTLEKIDVTIANRNDLPLTIGIRPTDLAPTDDAFVKPVKKSPYGAASWIESPVTQVVLQPGQQCDYKVTVRVPKNAPVGSSYAGLVAEIVPQKCSGTACVQTIASAVAQILIDIPGDIKRSGNIAAFVPGQTFRLGGGEPINFTVTYQNTGTVSDHLRGTVTIDSIFGTTVATMNFREIIVLRDSTRSFKVQWKNPPVVGLFRAQLDLETDAGNAQKTSRRISVLPAPWILGVVVLVIVLPPLIVWYRRRKDWMKYLDGSEAA